MNKFLQAFVVFLLWSVIALLFHFYISPAIFGECNISHSQTLTNERIKEENHENNINPEITKDVFLIADDQGHIKFKFKGNFKIQSKSEEVKIPDELQPVKDSVKNYLDKNPSSNLFIVVNFLKSEIDERNGENFGQKRGEFLKQWFVEKGVAGDRIQIEPQLTEFEFDDNNQFNGGISFYFKNLAALKPSVATDVVTSKTLRFSFGNQSFRATPELLDYVIELKSYLGQYPTKKIYIVGHTDSEGDATYNYNIGLKRAQFVKDFLISQQIEAYKIIASSKGETEPIADNSTREGKSVNRRIEIIIK